MEQNANSLCSVQKTPLLFSFLISNTIKDIDRRRSCDGGGVRSAAGHAHRVRQRGEEGGPRDGGGLAGRGTHRPYETFEVGNTRSLFVSGQSGFPENFEGISGNVDSVFQRLMENL